MSAGEKVQRVVLKQIEADWKRKVYISLSATLTQEWTSTDGFLGLYDARGSLG